MSTTTTAAEYRVDGIADDNTISWDIVRGLEDWDGLEVMFAVVSVVKAVVLFLYAGYAWKKERAFQTLFCFCSALFCVFSAIYFGAKADVNIRARRKQGDI